VFPDPDLLALGTLRRVGCPATVIPMPEPGPSWGSLWPTLWPPTLWIR